MPEYDSLGNLIPPKVDSSDLWKKAQGDTLTGGEIHNRPDKIWGYKLNLAGFLDLTHTVPSRDLVCFGIRENAAGMFLAHLYLSNLPREFQGKSAANMALDKFNNLSTDTNVVLMSLRRGQYNDLSVVTYDNNEIWPLPDPNNPGQTFDSSLVRRHCWGYFFHGGEWAGVHLSMPNYSVKDSTLFTDILDTFEFVGKVPDSARPAVNIIKAIPPSGPPPTKPK